MSAYASGKQAALEKFAIEFKSPKMQGVLQGALDKAYERIVTPPWQSKPGDWALHSKLRDREGIAELASPSFRQQAVPIRPPRHLDVEASFEQLNPSYRRGQLIEKHLPIRKMLGAVADSAARNRRF